MQCSSFTPVYFHVRDLNVGASGYSRHLHDSNASSYGEERGYGISMSLRDQCSGYDEEVLKQIMLNHEATFRYQVQELHRLYRRQRDLMDETRMREREMFAHHLLSRTSESIHSLSLSGAEFSQNFSPATNWLSSNLASSKLSEIVVAETLEEPTTLRTDSYISKNRYKEVQFLPPSCKQNGNDKVKQFKVGNLNEAPALRRWMSSDSASMKTWDVSSSSSNIRKTHCFIDLNEPVQLHESMHTSSPGPLDAFTDQYMTVCRDECVPVEAIPESVVESHGINSSMAIDLNSMPVSCFSETEMNLESPPSVNRKAKVVAHNKISETYIDLNTGEIKPAEDTELKGPVSPENEESSPPRGKSEDTQLEPPLSSEQGEGEPLNKADTIAAETLANMGAAAASFRNLRWFAEFASSTGDYLAKATGSKQRGKKRCKDSQSQQCLKRGSLKGKPGKKRCGKPRKCSKLSPSDVMKKTMSSILKQSAACMEQGGLLSWGEMRNRRGRRRRRASISFSLAELVEYFPYNSNA